MTDLHGEVTSAYVPNCTCGKCIVKRMRKDFFENFPYGKNLGSTYTTDFDWKFNQKNPDFYKNMHDFQ